MFNDLTALEGDLLCQKMSFSITKRNPSGNFPLSQSIGKHRTWKSIKWNTIKFVFLLLAALGKKEAMVDTTLSLFSFFFQNKKEGHKTSNIIPIKRSKNVIWESVTGNFFFFLPCHHNHQRQQPKITNRKSKKISFIKYLPWNECSWRLISLSIIIFQKIYENGMYHHHSILKRE